VAINALQSAASGLSALNTALDVTANNLANVNTVGFKGSRVNFQDLLYMERMQPGVETAAGDQRPMGLYVGLGVKASGTQLDFQQGNLQITGRPLDIAIEGNGFFRVTARDSEGDGVYARAGNLTINSDGELVLATDEGRRLEPTINIPANATGISVASDGTVSVTLPGETEPQTIGNITTSTFVNPAGLKQLGENLYTPTAASGPATEGEPGADDRGSLIQGVLEYSNVDPTKELIELIRTQRAFEMNSQVIRAADDTLRAVTQLRR
jgi:flagellar basal-body rod protein FlgG